MLFIADSKEYNGLISADLKDKYLLQFIADKPAIETFIEDKGKNASLALLDLDFIAPQEVSWYQGTLQKMQIPSVVLSTKMVSEADFDYVLLKPILAIELELAVLKTMNKARLNSIQQISDRIRQMTNDSNDKRI